MARVRVAGEYVSWGVFREATMDTLSAQPSGKLLTEGELEELYDTMLDFALALGESSDRGAQYSVAAAGMVGCWGLPAPDEAGGPAPEPTAGNDGGAARARAALTAGLAAAEARAERADRRAEAQAAAAAEREGLRASKQLAAAERRLDAV